jgi:outer membrane receptor protein involved in Fe transport
MRSCILILTIILSTLCNQVYAQTGIIRGSIIDDSNGEALIGATAQLEASTIGAIADIDGKFSIANVPDGTHTLVFSYVGYQTQKVEGVIVKAGEVVVLDIRLKTESIGLEEVVVTAQAIKNNEVALLTMQRKSSLVMDGISAKQFSMNGDSDAGAAIKRVTGVSVEGGKYVYVRGLGDRYSKTSLNNSEIPGLDPNRNTVQMDLFPSNLIDNLVVYKTFSPNIPANFTGGFVNISTKEFPDAFTVQVSASAGYNANATFQPGVITDNWGKNHWLGFADPNRAIPAIVADGITVRSFNQAEAMLLDKETKSFKGSFNPSTFTPAPNHSFSFSIGDQKTVFGKQLGFIGGLSYQRNYEYFQNGDVGRFFLPGSVTAARLDTLYNLKQTRGSESILWGGLLNTTLKLSKNHKIGLNLMHNQGAEASASFYEGTFPFASGNDPNFFFQGRSLVYIERSMSNAQLKGTHHLPGSNIKFDWIGSYSQSEQDEPDLKYFQNLRFGQDPENYGYDAISNNVRPTSRYFRNMTESNYDIKANVEIPVTINNQPSKIMMGGSYVAKSRNFEETIVQYKPEPGATLYDGDIDAYFDESNLGLLGIDGNGNPTFPYGLIIQDNTTGGGTYTGEERVPAVYAMMDWQVNKMLKVSFGARYEKTDIDVDNINASAAERFASLNNDDILPSINVTQQLSDNTNLRLAYGRTLARPTFRELAKFASFDFQGDFLIIGNPFLMRTTIDNFDLRWETFPKSGELISVSAFYKSFQDPIERAVDPNTNDLATQIQFRNVKSAWLVGAEFEFRKKLDFITPTLSNFSAGFNFAYIYSRVDIAPGELALIRVNDPNADSQRQMFGQSPYIVNALLAYDNPDRKLNANVTFNVQGARLSVVSTGGIPNVFEQPRPVLDVNVKKGIGQRWSVKLAAANLLNSEFRQTHSFKGQEYNFSSYRIGATFSAGISFLIE